MRYINSRFTYLLTVADIKASMIQGFGLGPASYVVTAADSYPCTTGNRILKYADDTYLVVPQRTQARDAKKSSKSASEQLRII